MSELKDRFANKVAVVTGAASGLAITKRLLAEGVAGLDRHAIADLGADFIGIEGDVTQEAAARGLVAAAGGPFRRG